MSNDITGLHMGYSRRQWQWLKVRDCLEGEDNIKWAGQRYLPKPSGMTPTNYEAYKMRASFFPVAERTLRGLTGLIFRNDASARLPAKMEPMLDDLTTDGYSFYVLTQEIADEVLSIGRFGMLVDFARDAAVNDLPHFCTYKAEDILNWEQEYKNGRKILTRVVIIDDIDNQGVDDAQRMLELILIDGVYTVKEWVIEASAETNSNNKAKSTWVLKDEWAPTVNGKTLDYIPFVFISPYDLKPDVEKPPFLDMCNLNVDHYQNSADYEHALYMTAQPTPWISGNLDEAKKPKSIGAGTIWYLPEGSQVGMLEFTGAGLSAQRQAMLDKEDRIAALGARLIKDIGKAAETAETTRLRGRAEMSLLSSACTMIEAALQKLFEIAADWTGSNADEVEIKVNKDFIETRLDAQSLTALVKTWQSGGISFETLHENLQKGEIMPPDRTVEEEKKLIDSEGGAPLSVAAALAANAAGNQPPGAQPMPSGAGQTTQQQAPGGAPQNPQGVPQNV